MKKREISLVPVFGLGGALLSFVVAPMLVAMGFPDGRVIVLLGIVGIFAMTGAAMCGISSYMDKKP